MLDIPLSQVLAHTSLAFIIRTNLEVYKEKGLNMVQRKALCPLLLLFCFLDIQDLPEVNCAKEMNWLSKFKVLKPL
jgi:hypothetical protein